jgi:hypothetical protein
MTYITIEKEKLQKVFYALTAAKHGNLDSKWTEEVLATCKQALEQPVQEPVAWRVRFHYGTDGMAKRIGDWKLYGYSPTPEEDKEIEPLYTTPPAPVQELQRYSPDGEGGMEVDSLGAYVKHQDVSNPPAPVPLTQAWRDSAQWLRNNYQDHPNIASLCEAMVEYGSKQALEQLVQEPVLEVVKGKINRAWDAIPAGFTGMLYMQTQPNVPAKKQEPYGYVSTHTNGLMHFNKTFQGVYTDTATEIVAVYTTQPVQDVAAYLFTNVQSGDIESSTDPDHKQDERELWYREELVRQHHHTKKAMVVNTNTPAPAPSAFPDFSPIFDGITKGSAA